jgi:hypothetical protein
MTLPEDERKAMSQLYMDKACEALQEARDNQEQHPNVSVTRAYYSMKEIIPQVGQRVSFHPHEGEATLTGSVIATDERTVTLKCGNIEIPAIREKGSFSKAPPLKQEETKEYAQNLARKHAGENGKIFFARNEGIYKGAIVELTPTYAIQKVDEKTAVIHRLKDLKNKKVNEQALIKEGENISIVKYGMNVTLTLWDKERESERGKNRDSQGR